MRRSFRPLAALAMALLAATLAAAQADKRVVWKLIDAKGKVTYVDKAPPQDFEGKVTRIEIDLTANRAMLQERGESSPPVQLQLSAPELRRVKADAELARAQENLEAAKKARDEGKEPTQEETRWIARKGGGARRETTDAYKERLDGLEAAVKAAEAELERARQVARREAID